MLGRHCQRWDMGLNSPEVSKCVDVRNCFYLSLYTRLRMEHQRLAAALKMINPQEIRATQVCLSR